MIEEILPPEPMHDHELLQIIDRERALAHGYHDELTEQRRKALYYYMGEAKEDLAPPEIDGRSAVVSKDIMEAVEWAVPSLVRVFTSSDDVIAFEPRKPGQEKQAQDATKYVNWVLNGDSRNNGFIVFHDAIKNSLIQRMAWVKVYYEEAYDERQETYYGQSPAEFAMLQQDPGVRIVSVRQTQEAVIDEMGVMISPPLIDIVAVRSEDNSYCKVVGVPPEEVFVSKDDQSIDDVRFICHERKVTASEMVSLGVDPEIVAGLGLDEQGEDGEEEERDYISSKWGRDEEDGADESQRAITLVEAYVKVDYDKDGVAEWRCVKKSGSTILSNDVVADHPFVLFTPILMPYQKIGLSMYDMLADLQRIKTSLQRQMLDNMYLQNNTRTEVVQGQVNLDDLLNPRPGGMIRVKNIGSIREISPTNIIGNSLESLTFFDAVRQRRSGISEMGSGLSPEAVNKRQAGVAIDLLQQAAKERLELIARVFAETAVKRMYRLILKCVTQYQNGSQQVMVNGEFLEMNPREWATNYNMTVSVGLGAQSKQAQIANYTNLLQVQERLMPAGLTTVNKIANAAMKLVEAMGHKDPSQYVVDPAREQIQQPPPQPDPNQMLAEAQIQSEQIKAQSAQQKAQLDAQIKQQELINESQQAQLKAETDIAVAQIKAETDRLIAAMKGDIDRESLAAQLNAKERIEGAKLDLAAFEAMGPQAAESLLATAQSIEAMQQQLRQFKAEVASIMSTPRRRTVTPVRDENGRIASAVVTDE